MASEQEQYTFDADSARRIAEAVRKVEGTGSHWHKRRLPSEDARGRIEAMVRVTSGTTGADGRYPGKLQRWTGPGWEDLGDVRVFEINGDTLSAQLYRGQLVGYSDSQEKTIWAVGCC